MRKYYWKLTMAKCQRLDFYTKGEKDKFGYFVNYDPDGINTFEETALLLRSFWESLTDYGNLWFRGSVTSGPADHQFVLSSKQEAVIYSSLVTAVEA